MRPVVISVEHPPPHGGVVEHVFATSPVQLGRNPKADLRLPYDFVSSWHALIRFDETTASYFDLGSTNGSEIEGRRMAPGEVLEFDGPVRVRIADLVLVLSRGGAAAQVDRPPPMTGHEYVPNVGPPEPGYVPGAPTIDRTVMPPGGGLSAYGPPPPLISPEPALGPGMGAPGEPPGAPPSIRVPRPSTQVLTPRRERASSASSSDAGLALVRELSQRLLPNVPPPDTAEQARSLLERVAMLVETCARGVVEMQAGQERMGQELGVQTVKHYTGLRFAASASAAIEYLLAEAAPGDRRRLEELSVGFADSMSHQVAMLDGLVAGARAMMDAIEPRAIEQEVGPGRIGRYRELWSTFTAHWQRLASDDRKLVKALFGPEFARVYAEVGGELSAGWRRDEGGDARDDGEGTKRAP